MAKYKSLVSTLFIYNKIFENVKKLENFEIPIYYMVSMISTVSIKRSVLYFFLRPLLNVPYDL